MRAARAGIAVAATALALPAAASAGEVKPNLRISPPTAKAGQVVTISGTGWSGWDESGGNCDAITVKLYSLGFGGARLRIKVPHQTVFEQVFTQFRFRWHARTPPGTEATGTWRIVASQPCDDPDGDPAPIVVEKPFVFRR
jgi:hypothetical protein